MSLINEYECMHIESLMMRAHHPGDEFAILFTAYLNDEITKNEFVYGLRRCCGMRNEDIDKLIDRLETGVS